MGYAETAQSVLTVFLDLVISGLTSIMYLILNTVSLWFQGQFVPIALRLLLGIVTYAMATI